VTPIQDFRTKGGYVLICTTARGRKGWKAERHGLATWLAEHGTDPVVIQRMLRHSSKDMTMHYVHAKAREAQEQYIAELGIAADAKSDSGCSLRVQ
jgi:integrase